MRLALRLRQAMTAAAGKHPSNRRFKTDAIADRDVDRFDTGSGSERRPDDHSSVFPGRPVPHRLANRPVMTGQQGLRTADGWSVEDQPDVARDSDSSRMREAMSVDDDEVWLDRDLLARRDDGRGLPERKQSWNVRKRQRA